MRPHNFVFMGEGSAPAKYLFVATSPTDKDDEAKLPLQGDLGGMFLQLLDVVGITFNEAYLTYVVGCRPKILVPRTEEEDERIITRLPSAEEVTACRERLQSIIYEVDPEVIVAMGDVPLKTLVGGKLPPVAKCRGEIFTTRVPGRVDAEVVYPVIAMYDVATMLANPSEALHAPISVGTQELVRMKRQVSHVNRREPTHG